MPAWLNLILTLAFYAGFGSIVYLVWQAQMHMFKILQTLIDLTARANEQAKATSEANKALVEYLTAQPSRQKGKVP